MHLWADKFYPAGLVETFGYFKVGDARSKDGFYTFLQFRHFVYFFMHRLLRHSHHLCYFVLCPQL
mgnify:CR=1 FL=1